MTFAVCVLELISGLLILHFSQTMQVTQKKQDKAG